MSEDTRTLILGGGTQGTVTRCRDFTRRALAAWQWITDETDEGDAQSPYDPDRREAAEDVLLLVSELVGNACLHAGGPRELVLRRTPGRLRIEVGDGSPEHPRRLRTAGPAQPGGHGLLILERLARSWGCEPYGDGRSGKTVWAEVPAPAPLTAAQAPPADPPGVPSAGRSASG
ncbi:ATP-binding protein [Streptomyces sp. NRRL S-244]|uniref:ATP-binding protein n=1 Tax=Streptomyces sp. NRRL S-244 TaxID=1463897 RepID=UPI00068E174C|nr:ATP-binding protein [Streptomyces sp. NRRL S-244]